MRLRLAVSVLVAGLVVAAVGTEPAAAGKKPFEDKKRGFRVKIDDSFVQSPPKLTSGESYVVADWYEDSAKFDANYRPTFQVLWFATPKAGTITPSASAPEKTPGVPPSKEEMMEEFRDHFRAKSVDEVADRVFGQEWYFGPTVPMAERWKSADKGKTAGGIPFEWVEINAPTKKKKDKDAKEAPAYGFAARLSLDRAGETIEVGFVGFCATDFLKRFRTEFPQIVRSFEELKGATDSRNDAAERELSMDPEKFREQVKAQKLIKGWKALDTKNYLLLYSDEVDAGLVKRISDQIESIRAQIYESLFPPDAPIRAISVVRVCKDRDQYFAYGGPGGSAGYWSPGERELVFYEDQSNVKDSLRVLYHEAFHQYIYYSVGDFSPHSWFNEGHGDFFSGHNFVQGKWARGEFSWRTDLAKQLKREGKCPPLKDWLRWTQAQYYGNNAFKLGGGENYALGWSFVWYLRTTRKKEYQGILDRYFTTLKGCVTKQRVAREEYEKKVKEALDKGETPPEFSDTGLGNEAQWLEQALKAGFDGVDMVQLEKDWLAD